MVVELQARFSVGLCTPVYPARLQQTPVFSTTRRLTQACRAALVGSGANKEKHGWTGGHHSTAVAGPKAVSLPDLSAGCQPVAVKPCYRVYMMVRPTEVDLYHVVEHTVYSAYMYTARMALMTSIGFSLNQLLDHFGVATATTRTVINFKSPLQYGDCFFAESVPCEVKGATFKFKERVVRVSSTGEEEQIVAEGEACCVTLTPGVGKPVRLPAPLRQKLLRCIAANASL